VRESEQVFGLRQFVKGLMEHQVRCQQLQPVLGKANHLPRMADQSRVLARLQSRSCHSRHRLLSEPVKKHRKKRLISKAKLMTKKKVKTLKGSQDDPNLKK